MDDKPIRTSQQNKAIHLLFNQLAEKLNESGLDMRRVLKPEVEIPWTPKTVKEYLWRPIQRLSVQKDSTTQLTTSDIDEVFRVIQKHLADKFGFEIAFPSIETIVQEMRLREAEARRHK